MKLGIVAALLVAMGILGCSGSSEADASGALSTQDAKALQVTTPDATAADNAKALANANMDPKVKEVLGGAGR